ncbi:SagB/ThcOx family dehydrogenase [Sorangium sp. So ce233]|uniref:SagB/ThcOx family dehydrogenase n=1 Tax=Sorangium sp. So ce233 TaxID=3133290 RepID=UPI003F5E721E
MYEAISPVVKLNPLFRLRFTQPLTCELPLRKRCLELPSPRYAALLARVRGAMSLGEVQEVARETFGVPADVAEGIVRDLLEQELLVPGDAPLENEEAIRHWVDRGWLDALLLHLSTRDPAFTRAEALDPDGFQDRILGELIAREGAPELWKEYPGRPAVDLPEPGASPLSEALQDVLLRRRSNEAWKVGRVSLQDLGAVLAYGNLETVRLRREAEAGLQERPRLLLNSAFSALETYVLAFAVDGLSPGLYHYDPRHHRATLLREGLLRDEATRMAIGQARAGSGAFTLVITAVWERYMFRYRHARAYRTLLMNVSELAQKYLLLATGFNLSTFLTPNFQNLQADRLLGVNGYEEGTLYVVAAG